jgi:hypothetical protein
MAEAATFQELFELLALIEKRPEMYLGGADGEIDRRLNHLELLLHGYNIAVRRHHPPSEGFQRRFGEYLQGRFGWSMSRGPIRAIQDEADNDEDAWTLFWRLVDEFRRSL